MGCTVPGTISPRRRFGRAVLGLLRQPALQVAAKVLEGDSERPNRVTPDSMQAAHGPPRTPEEAVENHRAEKPMMKLQHP